MLHSIVAAITGFVVAVGSFLTGSSNTLSYTTPGTYTVTVPANSNVMRAKIFGATGGTNASTYGLGGSAYVDVAVTPGEKLTLYVGGAGQGGGYNGGGGGGGTFIVGNDLVLAAGGGGGSCGYLRSHDYSADWTAQGGAGGILGYVNPGPGSLGKMGDVGHKGTDLIKGGLAGLGYPEALSQINVTGGYAGFGGGGIFGGSAGNGTRNSGGGGGGGGYVGGAGGLKRISVQSTGYDGTRGGSEYGPSALKPISEYGAGGISYSGGGGSSAIVTSRLYNVVGNLGYNGDNGVRGEMKDGSVTLQFSTVPADQSCANGALDYPACTPGAVIIPVNTGTSTPMTGTSSSFSTGTSTSSSMGTSTGSTGTHGNPPVVVNPSVPDFGLSILGSSIKIETFKGSSLSDAKTVIIDRVGGLALDTPVAISVSSDIPASSSPSFIIAGQNVNAGGVVPVSAGSFSLVLKIASKIPNACATVAVSGCHQYTIRVTGSAKVPVGGVLTDVVRFRDINILQNAITSNFNEI